MDVLSLLPMRASPPHEGDCFLGLGVASHPNIGGPATSSRKSGGTASSQGTVLSALESIRQWNLFLTYEDTHFKMESLHQGDSPVSLGHPGYGVLLPSLWRRFLLELTGLENAPLLV